MWGLALYSHVESTFTTSPLHEEGGGELIKLVLPRHFLVPVPNQESVMYLCVRDIDLSVSTIFLLDFGTVQTL
jgi:hypothetical protein